MKYSSFIRNWAAFFINVKQRYTENRPTVYICDGWVPSKFYVTLQLVKGFWDHWNVVIFWDITSPPFWWLIYQCSASSCSNGQTSQISYLTVFHLGDNILNFFSQISPFFLNYSTIPNAIKSFYDNNFIWFQFISMNWHTCCSTS